MAVVITCVWPWMLPPTIVAAPTSESACPKPAIAATSSGSLASSHSRPDHLPAVRAERPQLVRQLVRQQAQGGGHVMPTISGVAIRTCATTIPRSV